MTANDLFIPVRQKLDDMQKVVYSDPELIAWCNRVISDLSIKLALEKDPELINNFTITGTTGIARPSDFISFVGVYPLEVYTSTGVIMFKHLDTSFVGVMPIRYFAKKPSISTLSDTIPFTKQQDVSYLIDSTVALASTRNTPVQTVGK